MATENTHDGGDISSGYGEPKSPDSPVSDDKAQQMLYEGGGQASGGAAEGDAGAGAGEGQPDEDADVYAVDAQGNPLTVEDVAHSELDPLAEGGRIVGEGNDA